MHIILFHSSVLEEFQAFIAEALKAVAISHVELFLNSPVFVIVVKAVLVPINVFVNFDCFNHSPLAAATKNIRDWSLCHEEQDISDEAEQEAASRS